jgi:hypothetical protein
VGMRKNSWELGAGSFQLSFADGTDGVRYLCAAAKLLAVSY